MSDAIALVRPVSRERLLPYLDLDEDSEDSEGIYAEELADGAFLLHTFHPFAVFFDHPREARGWLLEEFGLDLPAIHDDPRGILFFDDDDVPEAPTYDAVVAALEGKGLWITTVLDEDADDDDDDAGEGFDLSAVAELAGQLFDPSGKGQPASSFQIGQMLEGMQRQLMESLGVESPAEAPPDDEPREPRDEAEKQSK